MEAETPENVDKSNSDSIFNQALHYLEENFLDTVKSLKPKEQVDTLVKIKKLKEAKDNPFRISHQPVKKVE